MNKTKITVAMLYRTLKLSLHLCVVYGNLETRVLHLLKNVKSCSNFGSQLKCIFKLDFSSSYQYWWCAKEIFWKEVFQFPSITMLLIFIINAMIMKFDFNVCMIQNYDLKWPHQISDKNLYFENWFRNISMTFERL